MARAIHSRRISPPAAAGHHALPLPAVAAADPNPFTASEVERPRSGLTLARHIIAHEIRTADAGIFAVAIIAPLAALAVLL